MSFIKDTLRLSGSSVLQFLLQLIHVFVVTKIIDPQEFGQLAIFLVLIGLIELLSELGISQVIIRDSETRKLEIRHLHTFNLISSLIFTLLWVIIAVYILEVQRNYVLVMSIIVFIKPLIIIPKSVLQKDELFKEIASIEIISYLFGYFTFSLILLVWHKNIVSLLIGICLQSVLEFLLVINRSKIDIKPVFSFNTVLKYIEKGRFITISRLVNYLALKVDYILLSSFGHIELLGYYSKAYSTVSIPNRLIGKSLYRVSLAYSGKGKQAIDAALIRYMFFVGISGTFVLYCNADLLVRLYLGNNWVDSAVHFKILSLAILPRIIYKYLGGILIGESKDKILFKYQILYCGIIILGISSILAFELNMDWLGLPVVTGVCMMSLLFIREVYRLRLMQIFDVYFLLIGTLLPIFLHVFSNT